MNLFYHEQFQCECGELFVLHIPHDWVRSHRVDFLNLIEEMSNTKRNHFWCGEKARIQAFMEAFNS
jgi:hypothetical protein